MTLFPRHLPKATVLDPAEDPPGSIDPLGTLAPAERLAELLFPGFTVRMWRPRLLTFAAVAARLVERVRESETGTENRGLAARLAFERLFVSALVRQEDSHPEPSNPWKRATWRVPGSSLARRAFDSNDTPLSPNNFLKGQAVNGPFGVVARLTRDLSIVDDDDCLGNAGHELLQAWSAAEGLDGVLDDGKTGSAGSKWLEQFVRASVALSEEGQWRTSAWSGWPELAEHLRPDRVSKLERAVLRKLIATHPIRARCMELLCEPNVVSAYVAARASGRAEEDRSVLVDAVLPVVPQSDRKEDQIIAQTIRMADAYERIASLLESAFRSLLWSLKQNNGQAKPKGLESDPAVQKVLKQVCDKLRSRAHRLRELIEQALPLQEIASPNAIEPLATLASAALEAAESPARLIETVITRHRDTQNAKKKGMWIDTGEWWTLMPGFGGDTDEPPEATETYLHPLRVSNAYSFLNELGRCKVEVPDGEA